MAWGRHEANLAHRIPAEEPSTAPQAAKSHKQIQQLQEHASRAYTLRFCRISFHPVTVRTDGLVDL